MKLKYENASIRSMIIGKIVIYSHDWESIQPIKAKLTQMLHVIYKVWNP